MRAVEGLVVGIVLAGVLAAGFFWMRPTTPAKEPPRSLKVENGVLRASAAEAPAAEAEGPADPESRKNRASAKRAADALREALASSESAESLSADRRDAVAREVNELARLGDEALPEAKALLAHEGAAVREEGLRLLAMLGTDGSLLALLEACKAGPTRTRIEALGRLGEFPTGAAVSRDELRKRSAPVLLDALAAEPVEVRTAALQALSRVTGQALTFEPHAPEPERREALAALKKELERDASQRGVRD
jgi:hypothetical protein